MDKRKIKFCKLLLKKKITLLKGRKKIRVPQNSMPGVGDYYFEPKNILEAHGL